VRVNEGGITLGGGGQRAPERAPAEQQREQQEEGLKQAERDGEVHAAEQPVAAPARHALRQDARPRAPQRGQAQPLRQLRRRASAHRAVSTRLQAEA